MKDAHLIYLQTNWTEIRIFSNNYHIFALLTIFGKFFFSKFFESHTNLSKTGFPFVYDWKRSRYKGLTNAFQLLIQLNFRWRLPKSLRIHTCEIKHAIYVSAFCRVNVLMPNWQINLLQIALNVLSKLFSHNSRMTAICVTREK